MPQPTIFVSYSQKDENEKAALLTQLGVLQQADLVELWSDDCIGPGYESVKEINQAISQARVAVLLISANFLTSEALKGDIPKLLQRNRKGLEIFSVIAKPCAWHLYSWIKETKIRPRNGEPVWQDNGVYSAKELSALAGEIAEIIKGASPKPSSLEPSLAPSPIAKFEESPEMKNSHWWERTGVIAGVIGAVATILACILSIVLYNWSNPTPSITSFTYQVRVQDKLGGENISNAMVIIEVGGKAPVDGITDTTGLARIFVSAEHAGQPGRLLVEAEGYSRYRQEIDITADALPKDILLEPES